MKACIRFKSFTGLGRYRYELLRVKRRGERDQRGRRSNAKATQECQAGAVNLSSLLAGCKTDVEFNKPITVSAPPPRLSICSCHWTVSTTDDLSHTIYQSNLTISLLSLGENFIVLSPKLFCESALNSILDGGQVGNLKKFPIQYIKTQYVGKPVQM